MSSRKTNGSSEGCTLHVQVMQARGMTEAAKLNNRDSIRMHLTIKSTGERQAAAALLASELGARNPEVLTFDNVGLMDTILVEVSVEERYKGVFGSLLGGSKSPTSRMVRSPSKDAEQAAEESLVAANDESVEVIGTCSVDMGGFPSGWFVRSDFYTVNDYIDWFPCKDAGEIQLRIRVTGDVVDEAAKLAYVNSKAISIQAVIRGKKARRELKRLASEERSRGGLLSRIASNGPSVAGCCCFGSKANSDEYTTVKTTDQDRDSTMEQ